MDRTPGSNAGSDGPQNDGAELMSSRHASRHDKLDQLWALYREACPDPDSDANFMPALWRRIDTQRTEKLTLFRRWTQIWVGAAAAMAILMGVALFPVNPSVSDSEVFYSGSYVEILAADHASTYTQILLPGDLQ